MNYPNPFNSSTTFSMTVPASLRSAKKRIDIYDGIGHRIRRIALSQRTVVRWDGRDESGNTVATGVYYYHFVLGDKTYKSGSMILLK